MRLKSLIFFLVFYPFVSIFAQSWPYGKIHCFGDSHCGHFFTSYSSWIEFTSVPLRPSNRHDPEWGFENFYYPYKNIANVPIAVHWMGARTMHRVGRDGMNITTYGVHSNDVALFAFGEIDVRMHIRKQIDVKQRSQEEVIKTLAEKYVFRVFENQLYHNIKCAILEVIPACGILDPVANPLSDRIQYTKQLNQQIALQCANYNILFIPFPEYFHNPDGSFNFEYSADQAHLSPKLNYLIKDHVICTLLKDAEMKN